MNKNIDLTKILKDCPKGWKFYSNVYGDLTFLDIVDDSIYPIKFSHIAKDGTKEFCSVTKEGLTIKSYNGECTFFPSKDQRDWSKFTAPWYKKEKFDPKTLQPFDKVIVNHDEVWKVDFFSHICQYEPNGWCQCIGDIYYNCIPYNDETKHLVGTRDEVPEYYRYWED